MNSKIKDYEMRSANNMDRISSLINEIIDNNYIGNDKGLVIAQCHSAEESDNKAVYANNYTETDTDKDYYYVLTHKGKFEVIIKEAAISRGIGSPGHYSNTTFRRRECSVEEVMLETDFDVHMLETYKTRIGFDYLFTTTRVADCRYSDKTSFYRTSDYKGEGLEKILENILDFLTVREKGLKEYDDIIEEQKRLVKAKCNEEKQKEVEKRNQKVETIKFRSNGAINIVAAFVFSFLLCYITFRYGFAIDGKSGDGVPVFGYFLALGLLVDIGYTIYLSGTLALEALPIMLTLIMSLLYALFVIGCSVICWSAGFFFINLILYIGTAIFATKKAHNAL